MTGKERVLKAIKMEQVDRTPWVPFVGCHGASLLGINATEYLTSTENIIKGTNKAIELYHPDGIPIMFDLQIEAETLGCNLKWANDNPPAVISHPLADGIDLKDLKIPQPTDGRIKISLDACTAIAAQHPDIAIYGLITGPFTLALHLLGTEIFMKMFDDPSYVKKLLDFCKDCCIAMSNYYISAGCDIIAVVDPMVSQIGPDQFIEYAQPWLTEIFESIRSQNKLSSLFVCGHAQQNIPVMCDCKCDNISIDENIPLGFVKDHCLSKNISFGGNMQLTTTLLLGDEIDCQKNAIECMETGGTNGFILAPGCDLPYATPPQNLTAVSEVVIDPYKRDVAKTILRQPSNEKIVLSDYTASEKVAIDIITLDSESCAPCQYMVDSVRSIEKEFGDKVFWREHKIKQKESLLLMNALGVRNVPTICIDGEIAFISQIPPRDKLIEKIRSYVDAKLNN